MRASRTHASGRCPARLDAVAASQGRHTSARRDGATRRKSACSADASAGAGRTIGGSPRACESRRSAECLASHREATALGVGQAKRSRTKMLPEDAILLPDRVDAIFLVAFHPASQGQHEEVQSVGHGRRLHGSDTAVTHVVSGIHSPRPFFSHHTGGVFQGQRPRVRSS